MFLDRLPPRIQGFKLRPQRFNYEIIYVKGSRNVSTDVMFRNTCGTNYVRVEEIEHVEKMVVPNGSDQRLEILQKEQRKDSVLYRVIRFIETEWPPYLSSVDNLIKPFYDKKLLLTMNREFLVLANRLVIPLSKKNQVMQDLHLGHLSISKCLSIETACGGHQCLMLLRK